MKHGKTMTLSTTLIFVNLFCIFVGVSSNTKSIIIPCKKTDETCITKSANIAIPLLTDGFPSLNIDPIDPVQVSNLEGETPSVKYKFKNVVANGYNKCTISNLKFNLDALTLIFDLICPSVKLNGNFEVSGEVLKVPVEGNGPFNINFGKYFFKIETVIEKVKGSDGEMHMAIKLSNIQGKPLESAQIDYDIITKENLPPEDAKKSKQEKLFNLLETTTPSFVHNLFNDFFQIVNKYLETIPFDNLFID